MRQFTVADIATRLGITESTVRAYAARGQMPPPTGRLGRTPWWSEEDVEQWLKARRNPIDQPTDSGACDA